MRLKLISCQVFEREVSAVVARSQNQVDVEFLSKGLHNIGCLGMRERIQSTIDALPPDYDAVLLGYGLCNHGLAHIRPHHAPLVLPRAHDCITLLLGSKERYLDFFNANPGAFFRSSGWIEHETNPEHLEQLSISRRNGMDSSLADLIARYGEENGRYLWEELARSSDHYSQLNFIEMGTEPDDRFERHALSEAKHRGWEFSKTQGDLSLLQRFVDGPWAASEFLVVPPGHQIVPRYDGEIVDCEPFATPTQPPST